eukprot:ctg_2043.g410
MAVADAKVVEGSVVPGNIPFVLVVNVLTALLNAGLFVRWISHRSRLGRDEEQLLRELPHSRSLSDFTALDDVVPVAPPLEWLVHCVSVVLCGADRRVVCLGRVGATAGQCADQRELATGAELVGVVAAVVVCGHDGAGHRGCVAVGYGSTAATWLLMSGGMVLLYTGVRFYADKYHGGVNWAEAGTGMVEWPDAAKAQARYDSTCSSGSPPRCRLRRMQSWQQLPPSPETEDAERAMPSAPSSDLPVPAARPAMRLSWDDLAAPALLESGNDVMRSPNSEHNRLSFDRKRRQWQQSRSAGRWMPPSGERATDSATGNGDDTQTPPADSDTPFLPPRRTSWTVYVRGLPQRGFTAEQVRSLFATLYPPEAIIRVEIAYRDRQSLPKLLRMRERARRRLEYFQQYAARTGNDERASSPALPAVSSSRASFSPSLLRWLRLYDTPYRARETDAVAAYASRIQHLDEQIARASLADPNACTSCAFVTFGARDVARRCLLEFARDRGTYRRLLHALRSEYLRMSSAWVGTDPAVDEQRRPLLQSPSPDLMAAVERHRQLIQAHPLLRRLRVEPAPDAHDILWQNVGIRQSERLARQVVLNVLFLLGLLFVSSPVSILSIVKIATAYATSTPRAEMLRQRDEVDVVNANPIWGARSSTEWPSHAALGIAFLPLNASGNASAATPDDWLAGAGLVHRGVFPGVSSGAAARVHQQRHSRGAAPARPFRGAPDALERGDRHPAQDRRLLLSQHGAAAVVGAEHRRRDRPRSLPLDRCRPGAAARAVHRAAHLPRRQCLLLLQLHHSIGADRQLAGAAAPAAPAAHGLATGARPQPAGARRSQMRALLRLSARVRTAHQDPLHRLPVRAVRAAGVALRLAIFCAQARGRCLQPALRASQERHGRAPAQHGHALGAGGGAALHGHRGIVGVALCAALDGGLSFAVVGDDGSGVRVERSRYGCRRPATSARQRPIVNRSGCLGENDTCGGDHLTLRPPLMCSVAGIGVWMREGIDGVGRRARGASVRRLQSGLAGGAPPAGGGAGRRAGQPHAPVQQRHAQVYAAGGEPTAAVLLVVSAGTGRFRCGAVGDQSVGTGSRVHLRARAVPGGRG